MNADDVHCGADFPIRRSAETLIRSAAEAGMAHPISVLRMTPREIEAEFAALQAERQRRLEEIDLLAWLIGRYTAIGIHTPKRYPRRPNAVSVRKAQMTDAEIRRAFENMAERRKDTNGGC